MYWVPAGKPTYFLRWTLQELASSQYKVDVVNNLMCDDDSPIWLVSRGKLIQRTEELNDEVNGATVDVGVDHVDEGRGLCHNVEGLDVVWLVTQVLLQQQ